MRTVEIKCDACARDLTTRSNSVDYRLILQTEDKPGYGAGAYTDMMIYPPVDRPYHFCGLGCLDRWRDHERHYDKKMREFLDAWVAEHGNRTERVLSYPCPPKEIESAWMAESRDAALIAFPLVA